MRDAEGRLPRKGSRFASIHTAEERFWAKVDRSGECWEWRGSMQSNGYGQFWEKGKLSPAHRWIYQFTHGPLTADLYVCHRCDNRKCVRPEHLFAGTHSDNMRDCASKGRMAMQLRPERSRFRKGHTFNRGVESSTNKLAESDINPIRARIRAGESYTSIGHRYGVERTTIRDIATGKNWAWLPDNIADYDREVGT